MILMTGNKKNEDKYKSIVKKYYNLFEIIIIALFSSNNEIHKINMELIMNDSYTIEFLQQFIFFIVIAFNTISLTTIFNVFIVTISICVRIYFLNNTPYIIYCHYSFRIIS